jgi:hypothetical protein
VQTTSKFLLLIGLYLGTDAVSLYGSAKEIKLLTSDWVFEVIQICNEPLCITDSHCGVEVWEPYAVMKAKGILSRDFYDTREDLEG